jgi:hypothetical protein
VSAANGSLVLKEPIQRVSKQTGQVVDSIAEITLRRPKLGDLVAAMEAAGAGASAGSMTLHLAARLSGIPAAELSELGLEDGAALMELVAGFMPAGLKTGMVGSPSPQAASASPPIGETGGQPNSDFGVLVPLSGKPN